MVHTVVRASSVLYPIKNSGIQVRLIQNLSLHFITILLSGMGTTRARLTGLISNVKVNVNRRLNTVLHGNSTKPIKASQGRFSTLHKETIGRITAANARRAMTSQFNTVNARNGRTAYVVLPGRVNHRRQRSDVTNLCLTIVTFSVIRSHANRSKSNRRAGRCNAARVRNGQRYLQTASFSFSNTNLLVLSRRSRASGHTTQRRTSTNRRTRRHVYNSQGRKAKSQAVRVSNRHGHHKRRNHHRSHRRNSPRRAKRTRRRERRR